ncbi:Mgm101 protein [Starmerella bacillaris]|uniref:Mitochondrial genome maintenance protein MGM101 n=1 Tax=Starmerella bacillaris TaxID=1247836 RepID=A0AAV5RKD4_STABA|nr:Mgm101 protein [Starmerella bacillaris]
MSSIRRIGTSSVKYALKNSVPRVSSPIPPKYTVSTRIGSRNAATKTTDEKKPVRKVFKTTSQIQHPAPTEPAQASQPEPSLQPSSASYIAPIRDYTTTSQPNDTETVKKMTSTVAEIESDEANSLHEDWSTSFGGLGSKPFEPRVIDILMAPIEPADVEITPDGLLYLPEIKYRRVLNRAFGPGGWGIAPRTKTMVTAKQVSREYGLVCLGRLVSVSRGEQDYFNADGVTTAMEGCKSNALMRCCKDLGIASELWDPSFIRVFKTKYCDSKYFEKKRRFVWKRKDRVWDYPYNQ